MKKYSLLLLLTLAGCISADPSKDYDGALQYGMGTQAEQQGNLQGAREYFAKAQKAAHSGRLGPSKEAYACYGWSRVSGYLGFYAEAETGFESTLALIDKAEGDADVLRAPVLFDLARMLHDTGQHAKAVKAFGKAFVELDRRGGPDQIDPWAYIGFIDDNTESLRATGNREAAEQLTKRSAALREKYKGTKPRVEIRRYKT